MLGRQESNCVPSNMSPQLEERYKRDLFQDMKTAIDCLKTFNDSLNSLHPDVVYKIRNII